MATSLRKEARPGKTDKISISLDRGDLAALRKRARRLYGGNLSAVVAEGVRRVREEEGREALVAWLGEAGEASSEERAALLRAWKRETTSSPKRRRAS